MNTSQKEYLEDHFFVFWNCGEFDMILLFFFYDSTLKHYFLMVIYIIVLSSLWFHMYVYVCVCIYIYIYKKFPYEIIRKIIQLHTHTCTHTHTHSYIYMAKKGLKYWEVQNGNTVAIHEHFPNLLSRQSIKCVICVSCS